VSLPCNEHVFKMHNKIIFCFDTFVIITTQRLSSDFSLSFCSFGMLADVEMSANSTFAIAFRVWNALL
jgi:hypothetical protein